MKNAYSGLLCIALILTAAVIGSVRGYWMAIRHQISVELSTTSGKPSEPILRVALSPIQQDLVKREYHISYDSLKQSLQSPNRAQGLRAYYKPGRLTVINRKDSLGQNFKLELVNEGIFADGVKQFEPDASAKNGLKDNTLEFINTWFTEQYMNDSSGIRQNFIIHHAPAGTKQLQVRMNASGMQVYEHGSTELELTSNNGTKLHYGDLKCWDANKKPLKSQMAYLNGQIQIEVVVANAVFPVTIDPLITNDNPNTADAVVKGLQSQSSMGACVSGAGDINNDGFDDIIVGAPFHDITNPMKVPFLCTTDPPLELILLNQRFSKPAKRRLVLARQWQMLAT